MERGNADVPMQRQRQTLSELTTEFTGKKFNETFFVSGFLLRYSRLGIRRHGHRRILFRHFFRRSAKHVRYA